MAEIWICASNGFLEDDVATTCADCRTPIVHRPFAPVETVKICGQCAAVRLKRAYALYGGAALAALRVPTRVEDEVRLFFAPTKGAH
jgi:hypothetical protein